MATISSISLMHGRSYLSHLLVSLALLAVFAGTMTLATPARMKSSPNICSPSTPCGWLVYQPETKAPDYYVGSPCTCPGEEVCVRDAEDVAITSFVYKCRTPAEAEGRDRLKRGEPDGQSWNSPTSGLKRRTSADDRT